MSDANATSTMPSHWPALDGLRGLAVAGVVAYHLGHLPGGFLGVDLFFVLSGFLITSLLVDEVERTGRVRLRAFWGRRFRRLLPAVTAMIAIVLTVVSRWGTAAERAAARDDAPWAIGYLANWHQIAASHDYWAASATSSVFKHLWSLAIEEQFYVVWPLVVWLLLRGARRRLPVVVTALAALASATLSVALADDAHPSRAYLGTDTRAASLLIGALLALPAVRAWTAGALTRVRERRAAAARWAIDGAAGALLAAWVIAGDHVGVLLRGGLVVHASVAAVLVVVCTSVAAGDPSSWCERLCSSAPLVWLGQRSYGVYLWHWPLIVLAAGRWTQLDGWAKDAGVVAATLVLTVVSYELLEQPIRRRGGWATGATTARLATAMCVLAAVVAAGLAPDGRGDVAGFTLTTAAGREAVAATGTAATAAGAGQVMAPAGSPVVAPSESASGSPTAGASPTTAATRSVAAPRSTADPDTTDPQVASEAVPPTPAPPAADSTATPSVVTSALPGPTVTSVLWIGDSVAADEAPAVLAAFAAAGIPGVDGAWAGRRFVESDGVVPADIFPPLLAEVDGDDLVVVQLSLWDSPFPEDVQRAAFEWFIGLVRPTGAQLLFVTAPPIRPDLVDPGMERQIGIARDLAAADPTHVRVLDTTPLWGAEVDADMDDDGAPDRKPDLVHVCPQGAARFATWLVDQLASAYAGIVTADPMTWAGGDWAGDERYDTPVGACAALPTGAG